MIEDIISVLCPECGQYCAADKLECSCIMANCEHCGSDFELDTNCSNVDKPLIVSGAMFGAGCVVLCLLAAAEIAILAVVF